MTTTPAPTWFGAGAATRDDVRAAAIVAILGLEVVIGQMAVHLSPPGAHVAALWPSSGLSVIALCLAKPRWRVPLLVGIFGATLAANLLGQRPLDLSVGYGFLNVAEATAAYAVLSRGFRATPRLHGLEDFILLAGAALTGAVVGATIGGLNVMLLADGDFLVIWRALVASHGAAILLLAPLAMGLPSHRSRRATPLEAGMQWALLLMVVALVFRPGQQLPLVFLPFPILVWGAARLSPREVVLQLLAYAALVSVLTLEGHGPFVEGARSIGATPEMVGTLLQAQIVSAALVALPLTLVKNQQLTTLERLRHSLGLVNNILESTTATAILGTDLDGRIEFFNRGAQELTGYRERDVVGSAAVALIEGPEGHPRLSIALDQPPDTVRLEALVEPFLHGAEDAITSDWDFVRRDGDVRTVSLTISRRLGADGTPIGYLGVADDVTDRRRHEAMVEAALEAEKQVVDRLAQLDQTKNDFIASVSHELRTPITSIVGYSQLLISDDSGTLPSMHQQIVARIERNGRRLMGLIEDMLTMSQVEVGNFRFRKSPIDLRDTVAAAVESTHPAMAVKELTLDLELGAEAVKVYGDAEKLERVFTNLLSNAAKFSHSGEVVTLRLGTEGGEAVVTVTDQGIGISPEDQAHLFDRFFRSADAHALAIQGVGLGLPIAGSIVEGHEGRIEVHSELGRGSTFVVRLPLMQGEPGDSED